MNNKQKKKKDGWFFTRNLLNEINDLSEGVKEPKVPEKDTAPASRKVPGNEAPLLKDEPKQMEENKAAEFGKKENADSRSIQKLMEENRKLKENQFELEQANHELLNSQTSFSTVTDRLVKQKERALAECEQTHVKNTRLLEQNAFLTEQLEAIKNERIQRESIQKQEILKKETQRLEKIQQLEQEVVQLRNNYQTIKRNFDTFSKEFTKLQELREEKMQLKKKLRSMEELAEIQLERCSKKRVPIEN